MRGARKIIFLMSVMSLFILFLWGVSLYIAFLPETKTYTQQAFADAFSGVNALFAGLAFGGVIVTIFLQNSDLNDTKAELTKTAEANERMSNANVALARSADERAVLEMFQTYCSAYFQTVKDASMSVLIACVASREYCEFVATRFFVAGQLPLPAGAWDKIAAVSYSKTFDEFVVQEQRNRYKLDELLNFFALLVGRSNAGDIVSRCDVSYSWWRPLLWLIARAQQDHYATHPIVQKYATPMYLKETLEKLDDIYGFARFATDDDFWEFFLHHPKVISYGLDSEYGRRGSMATGVPQ